MAVARVLQYSTVLWFHVPNGGARNKVTGAILKAMGVRPGVADLLFVMPPTATLYALELKAPKKKPRESQLQFKDAVLAAGGKYEYADSFDAAIAILRGWKVIK